MYLPAKSLRLPSCKHSQKSHITFFSIHFRHRERTQLSEGLYTYGQNKNISVGREMAPTVYNHTCGKGSVPQQEIDQPNLALGIYSRSSILGYLSLDLRCFITLSSNGGCRADRIQTIVTTLHNKDTALHREIPTH